MAIKYGFFNSVDGDRKYNADDISSYFVKLISNGVFADPSTCMKVDAKSGMTVTVKAGFGFINAKYIQNTSDYDITLDTADTTNPRIDRVVIGLNTTNRAITIYVLKGTAAATPEAPALTRTSTIYELCLAEIAVAANATSISQANITDKRGNSSLCGYVTGLIQQIDTTDLFNQYDNAFNTWFTNLQTNLTYNARVERLTYSTTTTASTSSVHFVISDYNASIDIVNVYVNGFKMIPTTEYNVNNTSESIEFASALDKGAVVLVEVLRSVGEVPVNAPVSATVTANTLGSSVLGDLSVLEV